MDAEGSFVHCGPDIGGGDGQRVGINVSDNCRALRSFDTRSDSLRTKGNVQVVQFDGLDMVQRHVQQPQEKRAGLVELDTLPVLDGSGIEEVVQHSSSEPNARYGSGTLEERRSDVGVLTHPRHCECWLGPCSSRPSRCRKHSSASYSEPEHAEHSRASWRTGRSA